MDRFDDMRAKSSKPKLQIKSATPTAKSQTITPDTNYEGLSQVTVNGDSNLTADNIKSGVSIFGVNGSYGGGSGGSGSTGYNVFVQQSEPTSKDGVWIKSSGGGNGTKFYEYATAEGEFLEASKFNFLKTTEDTVAQQIIDGYMYVIARYSSGSYKINLKTQAKTSINTLAFEDPSRYYLAPLGSVVYDGKIYVFGMYPSYLYYYIYDPATDTSSTLVRIGNAKSYTGMGCYEYDGKVMIVYGEYNYPYYTIYDLKNKKTIIDCNALVSKSYGISAISGYGKYVYYLWGLYGGGYALCQFDITTYANATIANLSKNYLPFAVNSEYLYLFNTSTSGSDEYYKYNLTTKTMETIKTQNKYYLYTKTYNSSTTTSDYKINSLMLDDKSGILYFRTSKGSAQPSAMQFTPSPEIDELENGTAVIVQSQYNNVVKMQDGSNIHSGVENAYIKTSDGLKMETTFLGYGGEWKLLANPNGETATVTFNSNGGTNVDSVEVVLGQKILTKPEPTRDNYIFDAWYLGSEPFNFSTRIIKDITLTAHWLEYEEVDYIESSGTQYVDTGVLVSHTNRMELDIQYTDVNKYQINGARSDASGEGTRNDIGIDYTDSTYMLFWGISTTSTPNSNITPDLERHTYFIDCISGEYGMDGEIIGTGTPDETSSSINNIFLFARKKATSTIEGYCYERLFSAKIYTDGTLVRNFQPIKIETGTYALIDKVNNKAYFNAGTGSFTGGNIQTPKKLEYIESTGTQYIDTGYIPNKTTILKAQVEFATTSQQTYAVVAGTQNSENGTNAFLMFCSDLLNARTGDSGNIVTNINVETEKTFELELKFNEYKINGTSYNGELEWTIDITGTLYLMARHCPAKSDGLYPDSMAKIKINKFQIYDNDILIRDFIPYKDEYGIVCLYDKVNDKKYYNQGTGEFIAGEEV